MTASKTVIGLTGGIGSGKTAASDYFNALGINIVDADVVARFIVEPNTPALSKITAHFGQGILLANGALDRPQLRRLIFNNAKQKSWLEQLLHPLIRKEITQQLSRSNSAYTLLVSPLLLETDQYQLCSRILVIDVAEKIQIERATQRDGTNKQQIKHIIASQIDRAARLEKADDVVDNSQDLTHLQQQLAKLHCYYLEIAHNHDDQQT